MVVELEDSVFVVNDVVDPVTFPYASFFVVVDDSVVIVIESLVLDAGCVSEELIKRFDLNTYDPENCEGKRMIARMPARNGYPYNDLYESNKKMFPMRNTHSSAMGTAISA